MRANLIPSRVAIRNERFRRGMTVKEVAAEIGITPAALNHIESGFRNPSIKTLRDLARVFEIPVADLLDEEPPAPPASAASSGTREGAA